MTIEQANQYFAALPDGFASTEQLRTAFTAPVQKVQFVGVAGTAGKTVVARLLAAILHAQGIHAGLYHAGSRPLSERICIDDAPVDEGLLALTAEALSAAEALPRDAAELAAAANCFGAAGCTLAVVELPDAGLAEALPGMPVCAVTSVGPDGVSRSVERLAALAAGVMRKGSICVTAPEQPKAVLSSERVSQGGVAALVITGILDGSEPTVETDLGDVWFRPVTGGYMGYIPVTYNAEGGPHTLTVTCGSLTQELTLNVMQSEAKTVDVAAEADIPGAATEYKNAIWPLYTQGSSEKLWQGNFASPVPSAILADYGARLRTDGTITGRATGINYNAAAGTAVTAPQAGTVVYAGTLALTGGTVVIDHGCGVKSYLFGLDAVKVQRGQSLARGEELGTTSEEHTLIWELRIGSKSVDPAAALTGSSGLLYRETM